MSKQGTAMAPSYCNVRAKTTILKCQLRVNQQGRDPETGLETGGWLWLRRICKGEEWTPEYWRTVKFKIGRSGGKWAECNNLWMYCDFTAQNNH